MAGLAGILIDLLGFYAHVEILLLLFRSQEAATVTC